jgi:nucleotide-binding universal stress UspA family protein
MFTHILVPLDGSKLAEMALIPAINITKAMRPKLTLLRVVPQFAILAADPTLYEEMNRMGEEESLSYLRSIAEEMDASTPVEVAGESGQPADVIINYAESMGVDLILMSSHGRSGISRWVFGSVAEHVMRKAPCSTAIVNARADQTLPEQTKVLIPLDGSKLAEQALQPGSSLAMAFGAELHLLRIIPSAHQVLETGSMKSVFDEVEKNELIEAEAYLKEKESEISNSHPKIVVEIEKGSTADNIINYAVEHEIGMIVMSSHGRSGFKRLVYGSVAEKVLRGACCTTMIIRDQ